MVRDTQRIVGSRSTPRWPASCLVSASRAPPLPLPLHSSQIRDMYTFPRKRGATTLSQLGRCLNLANIQQRPLTQHQLRSRASTATARGAFRAQYQPACIARQSTYRGRSTAPSWGPSPSPKEPSAFKSALSSSKSSAALRFASASTSAAVSAAGQGLKKLSKKASAARLRRTNTSHQQAAERDASYAALRGAHSPHSASSDIPPDLHVSTPSSDTDHVRSHSRSPSNPESSPDTFIDHADPGISRPFDVLHNVHVDIARKATRVCPNPGLASCFPRVWTMTTSMPTPAQQRG